MAKRVVLAYSGGLDTSVAVRWMIEEWGVEVVCLLVNVGQDADSAESFDDIKQRALAAGAMECVLVDARDEMAEEFCGPAIFANARYEGKYPLVSALSRPVIVRHLVSQARVFGAHAVAHGCTGKGNDQVRFEVGTHALAPDLEVLAPARNWGMTRADSVDYAQKWDIPIKATKDKIYSIDENLWGRAIECGAMEDPWAAPPEEPYTLTRITNRAPVELTLSFDGGLPVALDGETLSLADLIRAVNWRAGATGFGRLDMVENRRIGIKSREVYECPAALAIIAAHADLEDLTLERDVHHEKARLETRWAELVYDGMWFSPLKEALDAFISDTQRHVTGDVRLRFEAPGLMRIVGRRSPKALYDYGLATYDAADTFQHADSEGYVKIYGLGVKTWAARQGSEERRSTNVMTMWSGRFSTSMAQTLWDLSESYSFDHVLYHHDIMGSKAHVEGLLAAGLLSDEESRELLDTLQNIESEFDRGVFVRSPYDEDIHMAIERRAIELAGDVGAKMHTARSRNDQVATTLRLFTRDAIADVVSSILEMVATLIEVGERFPGAYLPGYTHLQRAQPVLLTHHLHAHAWSLLRDVDRLLDARDRLNISPLGAGALAGTSLPIDPAMTAKLLGFSQPFANSMDVVSDRDFVAETLFDLSMVGIHLSRMGEELVLWTSSEFGFATLGDDFTTGSSMLPQKKNSDVAELARGKSGRLVGNLTGLLVTLKGLPLSYNRDLQEDKEPLFDSLRQVSLVMAAMDGAYRSMRFHAEAAARAADDGWLVAIDITERLVERGTPFRQAHEQVGQLVAEAFRQSVSLAEVVAQALPRDGFEDLFEPGHAVANRSSPGAAGPAAAAEQLARLNLTRLDAAARLG